MLFRSHFLNCNLSVFSFWCFVIYIIVFRVKFVISIIIHPYLCQIWLLLLGISIQRPLYPTSTIAITQIIIRFSGFWVSLVWLFWVLVLRGPGRGGLDDHGSKNTTDNFQKLIFRLKGQNQNSAPLIIWVFIQRTYLPSFKGIFQNF